MGNMFLFYYSVFALNKFVVFSFTANALKSQPLYRQGHSDGPGLSAGLSVGTFRIQQSCIAGMGCIVQ